MTRLVLLSDLHFGFDRAALTDPLIVAVNAAQADLVIVAGDVTHRGRSAEFTRARAFLDRIDSPWIAVPGNHDVPLFDLVKRLTRPYRNWHRFIGREMFVTRDIGRIRVIAVNTVDPLAWQRGLIRPALTDRIIDAMDHDRVNVVVMHHPLQQRPEVDKELMRGGPHALIRLEDAGAAIVISGHIHRWEADWFLNLPQGRPLMQIHAGTALCDRAGDRQNEFAMLDFDGDALTITRHIAPMGSAPAFQTETRHYRRENGLWRVTP